MLKNDFLCSTEYAINEILIEDIFDNDGNMVMGKNTIINEYALGILRRAKVKKVPIYPSQKDVLDLPYYDIGLNYKEGRLDLQEVIIRMAIGKGISPNNLDSISNSLSKEINHNNRMIGHTEKIKNSDEYTYNHCINVAIYSVFIGNLLNLNKQNLKELTQAALLHDIGKSKIPKEILNKKGKLTKEEFKIVKKHTLDGYELTSEMHFLSEKVRYAILHHHEREDGSGYPFGIKGDEINLYAKIIAIADVYDALTSERVYKEKSTPFEAIEEFYRMGIDKFDICILKTFFNNIIQLYVNSKVELSNGKTGEIVFVHPLNITKPVISIDGDYLRLWEYDFIKIEKIIG